MFEPKSLPKHNYNTFRNYPEIQNLDEFDDLLEVVGSNGNYQKLLVYGFLCPFFFVCQICYFNTVYLFSEPKHWCHLPTSDPQKIELWIPRKIGSSNSAGGFSDCLRYVSPLNHTEIKCVQGWDYDKTNFEATIPSYFNWVCDKDDYVTMSLTAANIGAGPGALVIGWAGDRFGRKKTFFITCFILAFFKFISLFLPEFFVLFLSSQLIMGTMYPGIIFSSMAVVLEFVGKEHRGYVSGVRWTSWVIGACSLPLIAMYSRHWLILGFVTTLPLFFMFLTYGFVLESPQWLIAQKRLTEAEEILLDIAETNGTWNIFQSVDLLGILVNIKSKQDLKNERDQRGWAQGIFGLFSSWRLGGNAILLSFTAAISYMTLYGINYTVTGLPGNQFFNYFLLAAVQLPVGILGAYFTGKIGRRWLETLCYFICALAFALAAWAKVFNALLGSLLPALMVAKFFAAATMVILPLQAAEILPTNLRSNGGGFASAISGFGVLLVPSILYSAKIYGGSIPFVAFFLLNILAMIAASFLPETFGQSLPETIKDSNFIGINSKFWSFLPKDYKTLNKSSMEESRILSTREIE